MNMDELKSERDELKTKVDEVEAKFNERMAKKSCFYIAVVVAVVSFVAGFVVKATLF